MNHEFKEEVDELIKALQGGKATCQNSFGPHRHVQRLALVGSIDAAVTFFVELFPWGRWGVSNNTAYVSISPFDTKNPEGRLKITVRGKCPSKALLLATLMLLREHPEVRPKEQDV